MAKHVKGSKKSFISKKEFNETYQKPNQPAKRLSEEELKTLVERHGKIVLKFSMLQKLLREMIAKFLEGKGTTCFWDDKDIDLRPAIKQGEIISIIVEAEPRRVEAPGTEVVSVITKTKHGLVPPTSLNDFPINQIFEFEKYVSNTLSIIAKQVALQQISKE